MPLYTYYCNSCESEFDDIRIIAERNVPETLPCPKCAEKTVNIKLAAPAICSAHRVDVAKSSKVQGDFKERMQQIKKNLSKDKNANIPDF